MDILDSDIPVFVRHRRPIRDFVLNVLWQIDAIYNAVELHYPIED